MQPGVCYLEAGRYPSRKSTEILPCLVFHGTLPQLLLRLNALNYQLTLLGT